MATPLVWLAHQLQYNFFVDGLSEAIRTSFASALEVNEW